MKKLFSLFMFFSFVLNMNLAQTGLSDAEDFAVTDRFGDDHHLFDILDDGKYVLLEFFTHYCQPCCEIAPDINKLFYNFGCNKNQLHIISIEGAGNLGQLESFENNCGGTTEKPVITGIEGQGQEIANFYDLGFYPTILIIAPNREIVETDIWPFSYQIAKSKLESYGIFTSNCLIAEVDDISGISAIQLTPNPAINSTSIEFTLYESNTCTIELLDLTGRTIRKISNGNRNAGINSIELNTSDISAGTYLVKIETDKSIPQVVKLAISK